jgi:hypothetical protein
MFGRESKGIMLKLWHPWVRILKADRCCKLRERPQELSINSIYLHSIHGEFYKSAFPKAPYRIGYPFFNTTEIVAVGT